MEYCPKCGASLKAREISREAYERHEKQEKQEKHEKEEKGEKHEKGETGRFWALIGGLILVVLGAGSIIARILNQDFGPFFLVIVGVLIIIFAIYGVTRASRRSPQP